ncbi:Signal transduction histidine kinase [Quadrisphaera granulorum]|uniref:histidine kinase n=1 Tax=Quadrisphaera granulorum TaxID=317664 RepID=A0A316A7I7_9ACTN|nr:HAMP domain-containing sensor histidine kinase [Quadrisphaera granulorum]PWJ53168.1 signal transduction histidine kinase [Quadrisphaera granulorum]SZE97100.1 Signal transduction histidine kinase [Quadrisphaera granulorum]
MTHETTRRTTHGAVRRGAALHVKLTAVALAVMAATLTGAALATAELIRVGDRTSLDQLLLDETAVLQRDLPDLVVQQAGADGVLTSEEAALAANAYLALHDGSARHIVVLLTEGRRQLSSGPSALVTLAGSEDVPLGEPGRVMTVPSALGDVRVLNTPIEVGGQRIGTALLLGSLEPGRAQALDALQRIALAGGVGLLVGGAVLVVAVRRATAPLRHLAQAARAVDLAALPDRVPLLPGVARGDEVGVVAHEVQRMLDRISRDEAQRRQLLAAVSHELRTPLAVAQGHLEVFELTAGRGGTDQDDDAVAARAADDAAATAAVLRRELDRLRRIVDDLTSVTRGGSADEAAAEAVFVPDLLAAVAERVRGLGLTGVQVQDERAAPAVVVVGDEDRMVQALLNLVLNACTHTPPGTGVRVAARRRDDGWVVLEVADDGPGLDPAIADVAFEPFVTTRASGDTRGSGLGLSVVRSVTQAQGGTVDLRTGPTGTTVALAFPLDDGDDDDGAGVR